MSQIVIMHDRKNNQNIKQNINENKIKYYIIIIIVTCRMILVKNNKVMDTVTFVVKEVCGNMVLLKIQTDSHCSTFHESKIV